jgi:glycosyltransferase involved in cell wall biosynthesis
MLMRIAHVVWSLNVGGAETMLVDIINQQVRKNDVMLVVINSVYDTMLIDSLSEDVQCICLQRPAGSRNAWYWGKLNWTLFRFKPEVVHAHQESVSRLLAWRSARKVLTVHDTRLPVTDASFRFDKVVSISKAVHDDLLARPRPCPSVVVSNGIRFAAITTKTMYGSIPFKIVQVSRLDHEKKGQDVLLYAVHDLLTKTSSCPVTVDFIGAGSSLEYLRSLAQDLGIAESCRFLGGWPREQIHRQLHTYDLLVQPSRWEGFGLTIVEGMGAHLPVLVSDLAGPMEIIQGGAHGYFFKTGDSGDCAKQIMTIMEDTWRPGFAERLKASGLYAKATFGVERTAEEYLRIYTG